MSKFGTTPDFSKPSLCLSCRNAQNVTSHRLNGSFTLCRMGGMDVINMPQPVATCSEYDDESQTPLWQMEKVAWRFSVDDHKRTVGFLKPNEWKAKVKAEGGDPNDD